MVNTVFNFGRISQKFCGIKTSTTIYSSNSSGSTSTTTARSGSNQDAASKAEQTLAQVPVSPMNPIGGGPYYNVDSGYQGDSDQKWDSKEWVAGVNSDDDMQDNSDDFYSEDEDVDRDYEVSVRLFLQP